jgi:hypothetical protein
MKKLLPLLLIAILLSGCVLPSSSTAEPGIIQPTLSDVEMQTQIAMVLTNMPTPTVMAQIPPTNTPELALATATSSPDQPTATTEVLVVPTNTPEPQQPTATTVPTQAPPTATNSPAFTAAPGDPRGRLGSPSSSDPMNDSTSWIWPTGVNDFTSVNYSGGWMTLTGLTDKLGWRLANPEGIAFGDLYLEATFKTTGCSGNDQYGMIVRVPVLKDADRGYLFGFTCDGRYSLRKWDGLDGTNGKMTRLKDWTSSDSIQKGSNQTNRMGLMMVGTRMLMYANGQLVGEVTDGTWTSGNFGVYVGAGPTEDFAVQVDEMAYWKNPSP